MSTAVWYPRTIYYVDDVDVCTDFGSSYFQYIWAIFITISPTPEKGKALYKPGLGSFLSPNVRSYLDDPWNQ